MSSERILVVEDDLVVLKILESLLRSEGYEVVGATNTIEALHAAQHQTPDLMILDLTLVNDSALNGIIDGFSLLAWLRYILADTNFPVIIHTSDNSPNLERRAAAYHVYAVFRKGGDPAELLRAVGQALDEQAARTLCHSHPTGG